MTRMRHDCETRGCRLRIRWDPASLDGTLPRGASFGDMDGWAEIGGRFLFIEHKGEGAIPENGQRKALIQLARLPGCTVWLIRDKGAGFELRDMGSPQAGLRDITRDDLRELVRAWGRNAPIALPGAA
jgi:hypothetical protein